MPRCTHGIEKAFVNSEGQKICGVCRRRVGLTEESGSTRHRWFNARNTSLVGRQARRRAVGRSRPISIRTGAGLNQVIPRGRE